MPTQRFAQQALSATAAVITRRPWWIIAFYLLLAGVSTLLAATRLGMKTDQNDLVSTDLPYNQRYLEFLRSFGDLEFLYVVIESEGDVERAARIADAVAAEVSALREYVDAVFHRVPPEEFGRSVLLLGSQADLDGLAETVQANAGLLKGLEGARGFAGLFGYLSGLLDPGRVQDRGPFAEWGFKFLDATLDSVARAARGETPPALEDRVRKIAYPEEDPRRDGYLFSENGALAFVEILPKKNFQTLEVIREPLVRIREAIERVRARFPGVKLGLTGRPVLQADEMQVTNDDMLLSTLVALVLVVGLFIFFFRRLRRPLLAAVALMVAIAITFGVVTVTIGYLTLLSVVFTVMLVGLGIDFGVLFISRYQEELLASGDVAGAIRSTLLSTGLGIWTGGLSTSFVFYSALFVEFRGLQELGFVAGTGLLICLITMLTFLPALILVMDRYIQHRRVLHPPRPITIPALGHVARHPRTVLVIFVVLTLIGLVGFEGVHYSWNLLDLQAQGLESVEYELKIIEKSNRSTWYAAFVNDGLEKLDDVVARLRPWQEKGIVGIIESTRDFIPRDQEAKIATLRPVRDLIRGVRLPAASAEVAGPELLAAVEKLVDGLDHLQSLAAGRGAESREIVQALEGPIRNAEALVEELREGGGEAVGRIGAYQERWFQELGKIKERIEGLLDPIPLTAQNLPLNLGRRFVSADGKRFLAYAYPVKDIWTEENMREFVEAVRAVDPDVTGAPIQVYESAQLMYSGFLRAALYSFLMVFFFVLIDFRSLTEALLTVTPVLAGLFWMFLLMPRLSLNLNLANFFSLPILIGCAVDGAVHMLHRFRETGSTRDVGRTTGTAVCLAGLSNMFGFAAMGIARHRGVASLGFVTALGCFTLLLAVLILLPALIEVFGGSGRARKEPAPRAETEPATTAVEEQAQP